MINLYYFWYNYPGIIYFYYSKDLLTLVPACDKVLRLWYLISAPLIFTDQGFSVFAENKSPALTGTRHINNWRTKKQR